MLIGEIAIPTLEELFISRIEQQILSGRLNPGDKLPSERQLQEETKISKTVIHAGLVALEKKGFIEIKPRCGAFVLDHRITGSLEAMNALIRYNGGRMTQEQIQSFFEFRIAVEGTTLKKLAQNHTDEMIHQLDEILKKAEHEAKKIEVNAAHLAELLFLYQPSICVFSGNTLFAPLFNEFKPIILQFWEDSINTFGPQPNVRLARKYLKDIENGDEQAVYDRLVRSSETYLSANK
jgi:DNA-binding FadR family transcriptional regulator